MGTHAAAMLRFPLPNRQRGRSEHRPPPATAPHLPCPTAATPPSCRAGSADGRGVLWLPQPNVGRLTGEHSFGSGEGPPWESAACEDWAFWPQVTPLGSAHSRGCGRPLAEPTPASPLRAHLTLESGRPEGSPRLVPAPPPTTVTQISRRPDYRRRPRGPRFCLLLGGDQRPPWVLALGGVRRGLSTKRAPITTPNRWTALPSAGRSAAAGESAPAD